MKKSVIFAVLLIAIIASVVIANYKQDIGQLKVTLEHPFYVNGTWVKVKDLKVGDELTTSDGREAVISSIQKVSAPEGIKVYNMHVSGFENYFVNNVLVHNKADRIIRTVAVGEDVLDSFTATEAAGQAGTTASVYKTWLWINGVQTRVAVKVYDRTDAIFPVSTLEMMYQNELIQGAKYAPGLGTKFYGKVHAFKDARLITYNGIEDLRFSRSLALELIEDYYKANVVPRLWPVTKDTYKMTIDAIFLNLFMKGGYNEDLGGGLLLQKQADGIVRPRFVDFGVVDDMSGAPNLNADKWTTMASEIRRLFKMIATDRKLDEMTYIDNSYVPPNYHEFCPNCVNPGLW